MVMLLKILKCGCNIKVVIADDVMEYKAFLLFFPFSLMTKCAIFHLLSEPSGLISIFSLSHFPFSLWAKWAIFHLVWAQCVMAMKTLFSSVFWLAAVILFHGSAQVDAHHKKWDNGGNEKTSMTEADMPLEVAMTIPMKIEFR